MIYKILADTLVIIHLAFIVFVVAGGLLVLKWKKLAWLHLPCAAWGVLIEYAGWICPLTPWENQLREKGGGTTYEGDFIDNYILPVMYPEGLTHSTQLILGSFVLVLNLAVYTIVVVQIIRRKRR